MRCKRQGFTLIELLVVIAIIAVLMGILMPALKKAKEQAQAIACQANLKSFTLAVVMYAQDHDDAFTSSKICYFSSQEVLSSRGATWNTNWCNDDVNLNKYPELGSPFFKYLANARGLICPTFKRLASRSGIQDKNMKWDEGIDAVTHYNPWHNYTQNAYLGPTTASAAVVAKVSQVRNPTTVLSFVDEGPFRKYEFNQQGLNDTNFFPIWDTTKAREVLKSTGGNKLTIKPGVQSATSDPRFQYHIFSDVIAGFHNAPTGSWVDGKGNCAFVDGHVAAASPSMSFALSWPL
ncbi:type II secretion system protein [Planctomycetota bacterium]